MSHIFEVLETPKTRNKNRNCDKTANERKVNGTVKINLHFYKASGTLGILRSPLSSDLC